MIIIHPISPIAIDLFGLPIRWYAIAYILGFVLGFWLLKKMTKWSKKEYDDLMTAIILGVILGGRLGYCLIYNFSYYIAHPLEILAIWQGGMSFHGGLIGVIASVFCFARRSVITQAKAGVHSGFRVALSILDALAVVAPIGLFFGRVANFINMEVMGRETSGPLGIVFSGSGQPPRYPSPLFEAATEGLLLFLIMLGLWRWTKLRERAGALSGVFAILYAVFRIFCEQFREPDAQIGFLTNWGLTMGQLLSGLMLAVGIVIMLFAKCATSPRKSEKIN
ncbi:MAG: prolipoprotein diacylglyceryl transferase [Rickettsiales bacterium]|jgi:phosphatidylglycerol:prolipoprotein diacylglycerol transferase|nr:prolipoprotein diacylglyceryl transferase [Rickettsiales bacterium]